MQRRAAPRKRMRSNGDESTKFAPPSRQPKRNQKDAYGLTDLELSTVSDLIETRANELELKDEPMVFYPSSGTDYVGHTLPEINDLTNKAATYYSQLIPQRLSSDEPSEAVALLGPSNFDYFIALIALSKLGHTVLFLSTRISEEAHVSLLNVSKATCLLVDPAYTSVATNIQIQKPSLKIHQIASRGEYEVCIPLSRSRSYLDPAVETKNVAFIIHSSGSTALPKPNNQTHSAALGNFRSAFGLVGFNTLPLYHMQGLSCVFRSIMKRQKVYMYNAALPLTTQHLIDTLRQHSDIQILYGVPYTMKLLADCKEAIELCKKLEVLFCGGGACPKPIGDKLSNEGVYLVSHFGSSETGQLLNSDRRRSEIHEWDWLRPLEAARPYVHWEPYDPDNNIFELVVKDGWRSKAASNRDDGGYATKDLWERHPGYPAKDAWRYYSRKDDTIVLLNGEKANPLLFEELARDSALIDDAIVFGYQRPHLGLFVIASDSTTTQEQTVNNIWPAIRKANEVVPAHAQMSRDMIHLLPHEKAATIRKTDKLAIIRSAFYRDFAHYIDDAYADSLSEGTQVLGNDDLRVFLRKEIQAMIRSDQQTMITDDVDLFSLGIDSLQASRLRSVILKTIDIGKEPLRPSFVFDFPSITAMTAELLRLQTGQSAQSKEPVEQRMQHLIDEYSSNFASHHGQHQSPRHRVLVTGVSGSLGAHVVAYLSNMPEISHIYCLIRAHSNEDAKERMQASFKTRKLDPDISRVQAYAADLSDSQLGLSSNDLNSISKDLTCVIHCAWNVNFNLNLQSFEDCIRGTRNLIDVCLKTKMETPADFIFCSSVSTVARTEGPQIHEELPKYLKCAQNMGYAQSKSVVEHICSNAAKTTGLMSRVLRIGQIVGDTEHGIWNTREAIPLIIQSARTVGALPRLDERHSWLAVDTVAASVVQSWWTHYVSENNKEVFDVYNVVNDQTFHWTDEFLPMLRRAGLEFEDVEAAEWLRRLREHPDPTTNPPYKLIDFYEAKYGRHKPNKIRTYSSDKARKASGALSTAPVVNQGWVDKLVQYLIRNT